MEAVIKALFNTADPGWILSGALLSLIVWDRRRIAERDKQIIDLVNKLTDGLLRRSGDD